MSFLTKKPFIILGLFFIGLIVLPLTIFFFQRNQENRTRAEKTVILSYAPSSTPTSPLQIPAGTTFSLDVFVDPGSSSVSFIKAEILYDSTKFELAGGFIANQDVFSQIVEGPTNTPGKLTTTLSIGSDLTKALTVKTKVGTVTLRALNSVPSGGSSIISFGTGSQALAVSSNSTFNENVIANTIPATIQFNKQTLTCGTSPTDAMLVIDKSGSMDSQAGTSGTKLSNAKSAANNFIDILSQETRNTVGLSTFASTGQLNSPLTTSYSNVKTQINDITSGGGTCIECGITKANLEITAKKRTGIKNVVILLTDGLANHIESTTKEVAVNIAEEKALSAALVGHTTNGTVYYTIGLGKDVNSTFLTKIAEQTGGQYYFSPTTDQLNSIYVQISQILAKGSVSGVVFNDANSNGLFESDEQPLPGWLLQLTTSAGQTQSITTDSTGTYSITNLCDGNYTVKQINQSGWRQTYPITPKDYIFTISNGNTATDKKFGNNRGTRCSDGIDNDGNGFIDTKDSTCHTDGNPSNPDSYDPSKDGENGKNTCSDSKDNNNNGKIDGADPICHESGDPTKPWNPDLPEGTLDSKLSCTPTSVALDSTNKTLSVLLTNADGSASVGQTITWSAQIDGITISPITSQTDATGKATATALVPLNYPTPISSTITAKFAGTQNLSASACIIQAKYVPVATPTPASAVEFSVNFLLHGIGSSGDNANPTANSLSNKSPKTPVRVAQVAFFDVTNNLVSTGSGTVSYASATGDYNGSVTTSSLIPAGKYTVKISTDHHLTRLIPGILTIASGQINKLPSVHLVAGDANSDNRLDIRDYNWLLDCYSDLVEAVACNPDKKLSTDANDDGDVNQFDYNLFLREISTQPGE